MNTGTALALILTTGVTAGVAGCSYFLKVSPFRYWVYLFLACVPFDLGAPLGYIPRISVVDYLSLAALIALILKFPPRQILTQAKDSFGWPLLASWSVALTYSAILALILHGSLKGVFRWGEFLFIYWVAVLAVQEDRKKLIETAGGLLTVLGALMAAWALKQYVLSGFDYKLTYAIFDQHNMFAAYLSLCLPASWAFALTRPPGGLRTAAAISSGMIAIAFLTSYSRGAWLGMLGGITIVFLRGFWNRRGPWLSLMIGFLLIMAGSVLPIAWVRYREHIGRPPIVEGLSINGSHSAPNSHSRLLTTSQRVFYWKAASDILRAHPLVGLGPKNYDVKISSYLTGTAHRIYIEDLQFNGRVNFWQHLHNEYLQILVEQGWIGFILWAAAFSVLILPLFLFNPTFNSSSWILTAFQVSGFAFLLHNAFDVVFVNSFDLVFVMLIAMIAQGIPFSAMPAVGRART